MTDTAASIGYGTVLELALKSAPTAFTYVREMFDATPPADSDDNVEATNMQSPNRRREYIPGLTDSGEASFEMNYVPGSAIDIFLRSIKGKALIGRLTFANGVQIIFNCSRQGYETAVPNDDKMTATLTLKVSGEPYMTTPTAPRNLVAPVIVGVAQVGVALTVDPGQWAGATGLTFQWQADGVNVGGATGESFVPLVGNLGDVITCEVTAANATFSTMLETAGTAAVIAA
ncbi:histidine kinase [Mesorhizobium sp. YC-39]|uniref:phage tail tube protein n=1 Tax=unclassified Mesorhizobium TaxID=325217 RepID=UPI0021E70560|nr:MULTISPECIES: phage tail tube protein [unclassified Mesorhizobium]MCV3209604.1 histidine kinase [Mesorhizobium sp. YC-2]MCV3230134.1 histidine kinase [Mesorhizobium sp. YC-39]